MANRYALVLNFNSAGQFASSVHHWEFDDSGFSTTRDAATALINAWLAAKKAALVAMLPTDVTLLSVRARRVSAAGGFEGLVLVSSGNVGTRSGTQSASGLCPCMILYPVANDPRRGRWFIPGVSEADCVDGVFGASYTSTIGTQMITIATNITLTGGGSPAAGMVIYDRATKLGRLIGHFLLSDMLGTIRRRQLPA